MEQHGMVLIGTVTQVWYLTKKKLNAQHFRIEALV